MGASACPHCSSTAGSSAGRCKGCGTLVDVAAAARRERLAERADRHFGDMVDWLGALPALVVAPLVLSDVLRWWARIVAFVLSFRAGWRLLIRLVDASESWD